MQMLAEVIEFIRGMAVREAGTLEKHFVLPPEGTEPEYVYFQRNAAGLLERKTADIGPRAYTVYRVKDFIAALGRLPGGDRLVCVGKQSVTGLLSEKEDRRERAEMPLTHSRPVRELLCLAVEQKSLSQDAFIDFLRIKLAGCVDSDVVSLFRQLKFTNNSSGESSIETGRQQISRSVLKEMVANGREIPDEIVVKVLVYEELWGDMQSITWPVTCAVVIDFDRGKFTLVPLAGQLNKARIMTLENLADTIAAGLPEALVVCGEP